MYGRGPDCDVTPPTFYRLLFPVSSSNTFDIDVDSFLRSIWGYYHIEASMEDIPVVNILSHFLMGLFFTS